MRHAVMIVRCGFKIRKKADITEFMNKCMQNKNVYCVQTEDKTLYFEKDDNGDFSVSEKQDGWVSLEVARTNNGSCYKDTVEDLIWKYRKYINEQWLNPRN